MPKIPFLRTFRQNRAGYGGADTVQKRTFLAKNREKCAYFDVFEGRMDTENVVAEIVIVKLWIFHYTVSN